MEVAKSAEFPVGLFTKPVIVSLWIVYEARNCVTVRDLRAAYEDGYEHDSDCKFFH